jgi:Na+-transporting NADH:ubiquinone oxidoreductase subunit NqrE
LPFVTLLAVNAADIEATRASGCGEATEFGKHPSRLEQYGTDFAGDLAVAGLAFAAHKLRFSYIPQGMFAYGIVVHSRGLAHGLNANCH